MAKDLESLKKSRNFRKQVIQKYGSVPASVWDIKYSNNDGIIEYEERKQNNHVKKFHARAKYDKDLHKAFKMSSLNVRGTSENSGLSTFPPEVVKKVVLFYSEQGDTVLDPFAGHNSRMQMTHILNRNYIGYDVSKKFMDFNREVAQKATSGGLVPSKHTITLKEKSSEEIDEQDNSVDFIFTSPPYYKIEYYTNEKEQLYFSSSYQEFLNRMKTIVGQCHRVLKPGKFCVFNVNDFRYNKDFYTYHSDIIQLFKEVGFDMWDIVIIRWGASLKTCFASQIEDQKITGKQHEYLIVGKKHNLNDTTDSSTEQKSI